MQTSSTLSTKSSPPLCDGCECRSRNFVQRSKISVADEMRSARALNAAIDGDKVTFRDS